MRTTHAPRASRDACHRELLLLLLLSSAGPITANLVRGDLQLEPELINPLVLPSDLSLGGVEETRYILRQLLIFFPQTLFLQHDHHRHQYHHTIAIKATRGVLRVGYKAAANSICQQIRVTLLLANSPAGL